MAIRPCGSGKSRHKGSFRNTKLNTPQRDFQLSNPRSRNNVSELFISANEMEPRSIVPAPLSEARGLGTTSVEPPARMTARDVQPARARALCARGHCLKKEARLQHIRH